MRFETVNLGILGPAGATGAPGADGAEGSSAYEVAVANGFVGTEADWLASLEGDPGPMGPPGPPGTGEGTGVYYVADIATMRAIPGLAAGTVIYVGPYADQFIVVDDATLGADGGTVFIPNSELSEYVEETIPWGWGLLLDGSDPDNPITTVNRYWRLDHTGLDFESVELVMTDDDHPAYPRETMTIWELHGHVMSPGYPDRVLTPQLPLVDCGAGKFYDPGGRMTGLEDDANPGNPHPNWPHLRVGGVLLRYKYALSGLRLKRVTGDIYHLRWWPVVAVDEEALDEETDNGGRICWCLNAAAAAGAQTVMIDRMYYYSGTIEIPSGLELHGRGIGISGFKSMSDIAFRELKLENSSEPDNLWKEYLEPILTPVNHRWTWYKNTFACATTLFPATGATRIRIIDLEFDGNVANNLGIFSQRGPSAIYATPPADDPGPYAYGYAQGFYLFNVPTHGGLIFTTHGGRVIPPDGDLELHNVKIHGYLAQILLTSYGWRTSSTGLLELGDTYPGHHGYQIDGEFETVRVFGYCSNDSIRTRKFVCQSLEFKLYPPPGAICSLGPYPDKSSGAGNENVPGTLSADTYSPAGAGWKFQCLTYNATPPQSQFGGEYGDYPWPELMLHRISVDYLFVDASRLDEIPDGVTYYPMQIFGASGDNIHIKSGKVRYGNKVTAVSTPLLGAGSIQAGQPPVNNSIENLVIEYASRTGGMQLLGNANYHQATFRDITIEPRAATHLSNTPGAGSNILMTFALTELIPSETPSTQYSHGGRLIDFSKTLLADSLNGPSKYIDITPADVGAPGFRVWFDYNSTGSAPAADGRTLIEANVAAVPTAQQLAAAFSAAIEANATAKSYLTVATFNTVSVLHSYSAWQSELITPPAMDVSNALDVTITFKGGVASAAALAALPGPHVTADAYTVATPQSATGHAQLWRWDGAAFVDVGEYPLRWRQSRRNFTPSVLNFDHVVAQDPTYQYLMGLSSAVGANRDITFNFKDCVFGAVTSSYITGTGGTGSFAGGAGTVGLSMEIRDRVHFNYTDTVFDVRDGGTWTNLDLMIYSGKFRNCRARTTAVPTGITSLGTGYEMLFSEQSGVESWTSAGGGDTTHDIQTKLFWVPKSGNIRLWPANAATALAWSTMSPYVTRHRKGAVGTAITDANYYSVNDDRRAPLLRLNFSAATPAATALAIGWSAAVSP